MQLETAARRLLPCCTAAVDSTRPPSDLRPPATPLSQTSCRGADPVLAARSLELAVLDLAPQEALQLLLRQFAVRE